MSPNARSSRSEPPRAALVLSGGGATSAYAAGVAHALTSGRSPVNDFVPLRPALVTGTSAGAFNACYLAAGPGETLPERAERLGDVWIDRLASVHGHDGAFRIRLGAAAPRGMAEAARWAGDGLAAGWAMLRPRRRPASNGHGSPLGLLDRFDAGVFFDADGWRRALDELIDYEALDHAAIDLRIAATDWHDGSARVFDGAEVARQHGSAAVLASSAVPGFLPPVALDGRLYVDGSIRLNAPLLPAVDAGADVLHVIALDTDVGSKPPDDRGTMRAFYRSLAIGWDAALERDLERIRGCNALWRRVRESDLSVAVQAGLLDASSAAAGFAARPIVVHRYVPGGGFEDADGFFDLSRDRIAAAVELGFTETTQHDCTSSGCVLVDGPETTR